MEKTKKKRKFRWWFIPVGIVILILVLIIALLCFVRSMLPWQNVVAATSNAKVELSESMREFALSGERDYSTLPDPLVMADGSPVTTPEEFEARKAEILSLFEEHVYGALPKEGFTTSFEVVEEGEALNGTAIRKQVKITVTTNKGSSDALMLLYIPKQDTPAPVVIGLNSNGNHAALADSAILPSPPTPSTPPTAPGRKSGAKKPTAGILRILSPGATRSPPSTPAISPPTAVTAMLPEWFPCSTSRISKQWVHGPSA